MWVLASAYQGRQASFSWITSDDVRKALHLDTVKGGRSRFGYHSSGPASVTLWPFLATKLRVLIYNGDADSCVPYKGNEQWITELETAGQLSEKEAWRPWYTTNTSRAPAGYATAFSVPSAPAKDFSFVTIRLAGHMVPTFKPHFALTLLTKFLKGEAF